MNERKKNLGDKKENWVERAIRRSRGREKLLEEMEKFEREQKENTANQKT